MAEDHYLFEIQDGVGVITLNRPDRLRCSPLLGI